MQYSPRENRIPWLVNPHQELAPVSALQILKKSGKIYGLIKIRQELGERCGEITKLATDIMGRTQRNQKTPNRT
jgi:hypothetical protein